MITTFCKEVHNIPIEIYHPSYLYSYLGDHNQSASKVVGKHNDQTGKEHQRSSNDWCMVHHSRKITKTFDKLMRLPFSYNKLFIV